MIELFTDCQTAIDWLCRKYLMENYEKSSKKLNQNNDESSAVDEAELTRALSFLACDDRAEWINDLLAIKSSKLSNAYQIAYTYSAKSAEFNPDEWPAIWEGIKPDGRISVGTIFWKAQQNGFNHRRQYKRTDDGNAQRFADHYGYKVRWYEAENTWLYYDQKRWVKDNKKLVLKYARQVARSIFDEALQCKNDDERKRFLNFATQSASANRIESMLKLAKSELCITPDMLDSDPDKFNLSNGTLDLNNGQLLSHCATDFITQLADIIHDPKAKAPIFDNFTNTIFANKRSLVNYVQRKLGSSMHGDVREQEFSIGYGDGQNGKSTLIQIVMDCLGSYAQIAPASLLAIKPRSDAANEDVARLRGKRFVAVVETDETLKLNEGLVKALTGGDRIPARFLYGHIFEFQPQCKIWVFTNHKPRIKSQGKAIWRRIRLVPFTITIPDEQKDVLLLNKLKAEKSGILNWLLTGCLLWLKEGLSEELQVTEATNAYKMEMNVLNSFIEERCYQESTAQIRAKFLFDAFKQWQKVNSENDMNIREFTLRMKELQFVHKQKSDANYWLGIDLLENKDDSV